MAECRTPCNTGTFQSLVTFRTVYTAYTILADFSVYNDLEGVNTILGLQIWQSCERLNCMEFMQALPCLQSALSIPLPLLPSQALFGPTPSTLTKTHTTFLFGLTPTTHTPTQAALTKGLITPHMDIAALQMVYRQSDGMILAPAPSSSHTFVVVIIAISAQCKFVIFATALHIITL
ncbi:hypothetical protein EV368DRAFT_90293 [Lentinula lateritia]|nr:hypothetical protein EV368DRAFT_90293 [Lentinula lateritia]